MTGMRSITLILALIFVVGCITAPEAHKLEEPLEKVEINLVFPNGTIKENGTYILGDFKEDLSFKVEPEDAAVYFNGTQLAVTNGEFVVSVDRGGEYELGINKDGAEKAYNIFIGRGEIMAEWILPKSSPSNPTYVTIPYDFVIGPSGIFRVFYEDGTPARNRTIYTDGLIDKYVTNNTYTGNFLLGTFFYTDSSGKVSFNYGSDRIPYLIIDHKTRRVLLEYYPKATSYLEGE